jgi:trans-2-enoyl-CoA reductase
MDAYKLLGVAPTATGEEIRNAYKEKAMLNHPDRGGNSEMWGQMQKAYDTLCDPQRRAQYDKTKALDAGSAAKQYAESFADGDMPKTKGMNIVQQMEESKKEDAKMAGTKGQLSQSGYNMSHSSGFEAWLRNQKGLGNTGFYTAEDLLRSKRGGIQASDDTATFLPTLSTTAICYDKHGPPDDVLYVDKTRELPDKLAHGEVLVHMLAACVNDEDLLRVQTSLSVLNDFAPFNRTSNKWEKEELPAVAGVEGVGVVLATAQNVPGLSKYALEVKDWVIAMPDARQAPIGCWGTLCVCDSSRLLKVPAQMLPLQHYACSRSLCTAFRVLEDYGNVKPGDTVIQNSADLPTGQAVIQLCKMLKIRTINLVPDDASYDRTKELLMELGATMVLKDTTNVVAFLKDIGTEMPRLAIDGMGGEAGKRLAIALRPGGTLVVHAMSNGQVPQLSPSLMMYQQISLHGFNLPQWVSENGPEAYVSMLEAISELVQAERLNLYTKMLPVAELTQKTLLEGIHSHQTAGGAYGKYRERTVLQFGDEATANEMYFELQAAIRKLASYEEEYMPPVEAGAAAASPAAPAAGGPPKKAGKLKASERWADSGALLKELKLEQYAEQFEEEEMTSIELLEEIVSRGDGEKELMDALKEMGIKKMGHRQAIVGAVVGKL